MAINPITPGIPRTQSLERAVSVLRAVANRRHGATTSELVADSGLTRPTVARTLATLADAGLVARGQTGDRWLLGYELVRLARTADPDSHLLSLARAPMERLLGAAGESVLLAAPRDDSFEILVQLDAPRLIGATNWVGRSFPHHASAAGKLLLASLDEAELESWLARTALERFTPATISDPALLRKELQRVRKSGYAELVDELEVGLTSLAAPVNDLEGRLRGMVGISGPTVRITSSRRMALGRQSVVAAADISSRFSQLSTHFGSS
jgi:IclR family transcriptional regulator, acetate operon repressor